MIYDKVNATYLIIRADASTHAGTGHLMRCLALGQAWQDQGGKVIFVTACESNTLQRRLLDEGFQVVSLEGSYPDPCDWEYTSQILAKHPGAWVALDGYHFDSTYQHRIKQANHPLLVIDDMAHLDYYYADIVLNQNLYSEDLQYSCEPHTHFLLGTKYILLRREFRRWQRWQRPITEVARKVLVTMGGSDPENVTLKVVKAIQKLDIDGVEARVVVGGSNPHYSTLQAAIQSSHTPIYLEHNVVDIANVMAWADIAISAGGSTVWELAFMRLPTVVVAIADNQREIVAKLSKKGFMLSLGWHTEFSILQAANILADLIKNAYLRQQMSQRNGELVDGQGSTRVVENMNLITRLKVG